MNGTPTIFETCSSTALQPGVGFGSLNTETGHLNILFRYTINIGLHLKIIRGIFYIGL